MAKQKDIIVLYVLFNICFLVSMTIAHYDQQQETHYSQKQPATVKTHSSGHHHHQHHSSSKTTAFYSSSGKAAHSQNQTGKPAHPVKPAKPTPSYHPLPHKGKPAVPVKKPSPVHSVDKPTVPVTHKPVPSFPRSPTKNSPVTAKPSKPAPSYQPPTTPVKHKLTPSRPSPAKISPVPLKHKPSPSRVPSTPTHNPYSPATPDPVTHKPAPSFPQSPTKNSPVTVKPSKPAPSYQPPTTPVKHKLTPSRPSPAKISPVPLKHKPSPSRASSTPTHNPYSPATPDHEPNPLATTPIPVTPAPAPPTPAANQSDVDFKNCFKDVFVFGESSSDTGNGYSVGGIQPYVYSPGGRGRNQGSSGLGGGAASLEFFGAKSGFSKGNRFYGSAAGNFGGGHRLSNGGLVVDYVTKTLAVKNPVPYTSLSGGGGEAADGGCINFAIAGASSLSAEFYKSHKAGHAFMFKEIPETFQTQIDWFAQVVAEKMKKFGQRKCQEDIANTLFWVGGIGANDYSRMFGSDVNTQFINEASVNLVTKMVKALLKDGAQYIIVQGLAPIGCTPSQLSLCSSSDRDDSGCSAQANSIIKSHNSLLQQKLQVFRELYPKCTIVYGDTYAAYLHILKNHNSFGFTEPFKACCGAPTSPAGKPYNFDSGNICGTDASSQCQDSTKYISWDGIHLTDTMNKNVADLLLHKGFCQPPFDEVVRKKKGIY